MLVVGLLGLGAMLTRPLGPPGEEAAVAPQPDASSAHAEPRDLKAIVEAHWQYVGRLLRHFGVRDELDDALQEVFATFAQKREVVELGKERAFLASTAVHIAARHRRKLGRNREDTGQELSVAAAVAPDLDPEAAAARNQALLRLDRVLSTMTAEQREVFVLYEIEELTMAEIAEALEVAPGTVASRLRRARELFRAGVGA